MSTRCATCSNRPWQSQLGVLECYENPVRIRSGDERLIAWHNSSIRDKDGSIGALSAGEDITERKQQRKICARAKSGIGSSLTIRLPVFSRLMHKGLHFC